MTLHHSFAQVLSLAGFAFVLAGCANLKVTHVQPGESLRVALARKGELVRMPYVAPAPAAPGSITAVEPELPGESVVERLGEAYSRGQFCLEVGKDEEAITAFEEAVKIDPAFTEAWQQLAPLYEKKGDTKKAANALRRGKKVAQH